MVKVVINRLLEDEKQTLGELFVYHNGKKVFECKTLELPWENNTRMISRIPPGTYRAIHHTSHKLGKVIWLQDVPGREWIYIHLGNFYTEILGCVLVGKSYYDLNRDGHDDVVSSANTMKELLEHTSAEMFVEVNDKIKNMEPKTDTVEELKDMPLHEERQLAEDIVVLRVPNGWIYTYALLEKTEEGKKETVKVVTGVKGMTSTFVPEFV
ncbi:MAG: hypothetical protein F6K19_01440 [Cyanothece sp. SIO1E1]|nr:hypothetical protein [Cyanothece sp. SIO1E1]